MQQPLKFGVSAVTADGRDVGSLYRVVVEVGEQGGPGAGTVTAITVRRRLLESGNLLKPGGWEAPRDLRVPFTAVTGADGGEVRLALTEEEFLALPPYVLGEVAEPEPGFRPPPSFAAEDVVMEVSGALGGVYQRPTAEQNNRAPTERHLSHETAVWQREPHTHAGDLDIVLMDDVSNAVEALVVRQGVLFSHDVLTPADYVVDLLDDLVHIDIPAGNVHALPPYHPQG